MVAQLVHPSTFMDSATTRLKMLISESGLSQVEIAEKIGKTKSLVSTYLNPGRQISPLFLQLLEDRLGWSARWIRTGQGPKKINKASHHPISDDIPTIADPSVPYEPGQIVRGNIKSIMSNIREMYTPVRLLSARAQAGIPPMTQETYNLDWLDETYPVFMPTITIDQRHLVIEVVGDSMVPEIKNGAFVLSEAVSIHNIKYESGGIYAVLFGGNNFVVKRIKTNELNVNGSLNLWSDNQLYGNISVRGDDIIHMWRIIGKVWEPMR